MTDLKSLNASSAGYVDGRLSITRDVGLPANSSTVAVRRDWRGMVRTSSVALALSLLQVSVAWCQAAPPNVNFDGLNFPCISYNIATAQNAGAPAALTKTTNQTTINNNRAALCGPLANTVTNLNNANGPGTPASCDEYPFATSNQGGAGQALIVPAFENSAQGGVLAAFYKLFQLGNNGAYTVSTSNVPVVGNNPGQITIVNVGGALQCYY
jgi:hypothetical protein